MIVNCSNGEKKNVVNGIFSDFCAGQRAAEKAFEQSYTCDFVSPSNTLRYTDRGT
jgi:hypothetical protein